MADTDTLPPLEDIPEDLLTRPLNPTASAGAWAATFGGSDTNLAQRRRHNVDLVEHGQAQQAAQKAHFFDELGKDKIKQDLYFRQRTLDSTIANREAALGLREKQFDATLAAKEKMNEVTGDLRLAQTQLAQQRATALASASKAKMELQASEAADTTAASEKFLVDKQAGKFRVGSPEMADYLIDLKAAHPAMGKNTFDSIWKGTNSALAPEEYAAKKAQQAATLAATTARTAASDATAAVKEAVVPMREASDLNKEISAIEKVRQPWKGTTGIFTDKKGVERFGKAGLDASESPVATPELKAEYQRYQHLILKRAAHDAGAPIKKFNPESGKIEP